MYEKIIIKCDTCCKKLVAIKEVSEKLFIQQILPPTMKLKKKTCSPMHPTIVPSGSYRCNFKALISFFLRIRFPNTNRCIEGDTLLEVFMNVTGAFVTKDNMKKSLAHLDNIITTYDKN